MAKLSEAERIRLEFTWANGAVREATPDDADAFQGLRHGSRMFVYPDKLLIAWSLDAGLHDGVTIHNVYRVTGIDCDFLEGIRLVLCDQQDQRHLISHVPIRLPGLDVFLWMPAFNEVRFTPKDWFKPMRPTQFRVGLNFKQTRSLAGGPEEGCHYFSELVDFRRRFPHLSDLRF